MRILILGGTGMFGHRLWIELSRVYETWATIRCGASSIPVLPNVDSARVCPGTDLTHMGAAAHVLETIRPQVVVNCVGLVRQRPFGADPLTAIKLNALLPHELLGLCTALEARLIHVSTDCVFSGRRGGYVEDDVSDAEDLYGRTKFLGELSEPALTIRTSMVGRELGGRYGLLEWFLAQEGHVRGFTRAFFSGLTTAALARVFREQILPRPELQGLYHVSSAPISKFDLLHLIKTSFGRAIRIEPDDGIAIDRTLDSSRFREATGFQPASWAEMVEEMAGESPDYERLVV